MKTWTEQSTIQSECNKLTSDPVGQGGSCPCVLYVLHPILNPLYVSQGGSFRASTFSLRVVSAMAKARQNVPSITFLGRRLHSPFLLLHLLASLLTSLFPLQPPCSHRNPPNFSGFNVFRLEKREKTRLTTPRSSRDGSEWEVFVFRNSGYSWISLVGWPSRYMGQARSPGAMTHSQVFPGLPQKMESLGSPSSAALPCKQHGRSVLFVPLGVQPTSEKTPQGRLQMPYIYIYI